VRLNAAGALERTSQLSLADLKVWAEKELAGSSSLLQLASWLLNEHDSNRTARALP
jgi:hypothetical protein